MNFIYFFKLDNNFNQQNFQNAMQTQDSKKIISTQQSQVKSSVEHVEIDIFNTDISISRISNHLSSK